MKPRGKAEDAENKVHFNIYIGDAAEPKMYRIGLYSSFSQLLRLLGPGTLHVGENTLAPTETSADYGFAKGRANVITATFVPEGMVLSNTVEGSTDAAKADLRAATSSQSGGVGHLPSNSTMSAPPLTSSFRQQTAVTPPLPHATTSTSENPGVPHHQEEQSNHTPTWEPEPSPAMGGLSRVDHQQAVEFQRRTSLNNSAMHLATNNTAGTSQPQLPTPHRAQNTTSNNFSTDGSFNNGPSVGIMRHGSNPVLTPNAPSDRTAHVDDFQTFMNTQEIPLHDSSPPGNLGMQHTSAVKTSFNSGQVVRTSSGIARENSAPHLRKQSSSSIVASEMAQRQQSMPRGTAAGISTVSNTGPLTVHQPSASGVLLPQQSAQVSFSQHQSSMNMGQQHLRSPMLPQKSGSITSPKQQQQQQYAPTGSIYPTSAAGESDVRSNMSSAHSINNVTQHASVAAPYNGMNIGSIGPNVVPRAGQPQNTPQTRPFTHPSSHVMNTTMDPHVTSMHHHSLGSLVSQDTASIYQSNASVGGVAGVLLLSEVFQLRHELEMERTQRLALEHKMCDLENVTADLVSYTHDMHDTNPQLAHPAIGYAHSDEALHSMRYITQNGAFDEEADPTLDHYTSQPTGNGMANRSPQMLHTIPAHNAAPSGPYRALSSPSRISPSRGSYAASHTFGGTNSLTSNRVYGTHGLNASLHGLQPMTHHSLLPMGSGSEVFEEHMRMMETLRQQRQKRLASYAQHIRASRM